MLIDVVPVYLADEGQLVQPLCARLGQVFGGQVRLRTPWFDPEEAYDESRGQYNSTLLLRQLLAGPAQDAAKVLGVTSVDLFIPVLTYVFGEAQLRGRAAVVSTHRLRREVYGLPPDAGLLHERLAKEAVHELGHTFGLLHCLDPQCVMHASTYVEEIDIKGAGFCGGCVEALRAAPG